MAFRLNRYFSLHTQNFAGAARRLLHQPFATTMTVLVIAIALALPAGLRVLINNVGGLSSSWQGAADFSVYLKMDVPPAQAKALAGKIGARPDVDSVQLISRGEALAKFRANSGFGKALDTLDKNPLPATLVVRPVDGASGNVQGLATDLKTMPEVQLVQLDTQWVARLRAIIELAGRLLDVVALLLALAVILVIGNTIRLEINNRSTEIEVMKLVGGSDAFIRRPFLYLGFWYGLAGAIVATVLVAGTLIVVEPSARAVATLYQSDFRIAGLTVQQTAILLVGGPLLGLVGASVAAARHLHAIEPE